LKVPKQFIDFVMKIGQIKNRIGNYSRSKIVGVSIKFLSFCGSWGGGFLFGNRIFGKKRV